MFDQPTLVRIVYDGLQDAAPKIGASRWVEAVGDEIKKRLKNLNSNIECGFWQYAKKPEDERELLFDFIAIVCDPSDTKKERYTTQTLIAGEIESHKQLDKDFDKLMVTDALVCFFAFKGIIKEHAPQSELDFFQAVAKRRRDHALRRGLNPPPVFVLASHHAGKFNFRFEPETASPI